MLQRIPNVDAQNTDGKNTGSTGDDPDEWLNLVNLGQKLLLLLFLVVGRLVEKIWSSS